MARNLDLFGVLAIVAAAGCLATDAQASTPAPAASPDLLLARLAYVRNDYGHAVVDGKLVDEHEWEEQDEIVEEAVETARTLPLSAETMAALGALDAAVGRHAPAEEVASAIDAVSKRVRDELWVELATPDPARLADGAALFARDCAVCHGAKGEGPPPEMSTLRPEPPALASPAVSAGLSPRRVYSAVTFGVPETAMVPRTATLSEAERWALAFWVVGMGDGAASAAAPMASPPPAATPPVAVGPAAPYTLEALAERTNAELLAQAPGADRATWRSRTVATAAASPLRELRELARASANPQRPSADDWLATGWAAARPTVAARDARAAERVDVALAELRGASESCRRDAALALSRALTDAERASAGIN